MTEWNCNIYKNGPIWSSSSLGHLNKMMKWVQRWIYERAIFNLPLRLCNAYLRILPKAGAPNKMF